MRQYNHADNDSSNVIVQQSGWWRHQHAGSSVAYKGRFYQTLWWL